MCPELVEGHVMGVMRPEPVEGHSADVGLGALSLSKGTTVFDLVLLPAWTLWCRPRRRQGQALRVAYGQP